MEIPSPYRFETFAEGESSRLAFAACNAIAEGNKAPGNPLVLVGGTGLGKTHLLHSVLNALQSKNQNLKIICTTASEFYREFAKNIKLKKENIPEPIEEMSAKFRNADVLILDDLQNIEGKPASQHELLQIFNTMLLAGKPIIAASQVPISGMKDLNESLRSRLTGGLVVQISAPTLVDRLAILRKIFDMIQLKIDESILQFLAEKTAGTVHDLKGVANNISFKVKQINRDISLEMALEVLEEHFSNSQRVLSIETVVKNVAANYGISLELLKQKGRGSKEAVLARQVAMYFIRKQLGKSYEYIGKYFNRDHSTALYACKLVEKRIKKDMPFGLEIKRIKNALYE
ncbi:MAG: AAA family ATPase [Candidatus Fibromonas sp.]|jgi:chromosomal replication initiator protein|nr:AAA family ATPase [Candidatus Fibromonas sp.]